MKKETESECCVYSIKVTLEYIGVTKNFGNRMKSHFEDTYNNKSDLRVHHAMRESINGVSVKTIFHGTEQECYDEEKRLRPHPNMGLNEIAGGRQEDIEGAAPSQNTYKVINVRLTKLLAAYKYKNTVIETDRGEYIDYDNNYDKWKSVKGKFVSAQLSGQKSSEWEWIELIHVAQTGGE